MRVKKFLQSATVAVCALALAACGGSGDGGSTLPTAVSGFSKGVITAKGSVTVNGIKFTTAPGIVQIEDNATKLNDDTLKVGMVVKIKGTIDDSSGTGVATAIEFDDNLQGKVEGFNSATGTFTVLGQTIKTNASTVFDDFAIALANGDIVEVSGLPDGTGAILATRLEKKTGAGAGEDFEFKGTVSDFTGAGDTVFTVTPPNGTPITVTFAGAMTGITNGSFVEVRMATTAAGAAVTATDVKIEDDLKPDDKQHVEVKGLVVGLSGKLFTVNGIAVDATAVTLPAGLANGKEVEVEGIANAAGTLVATKVKLEQEKNLLLEGNVTAKGASSLTLHGKTVNLSSGTLFKDSSAAKVVSFSLANITVGDHVQVVGFEDATGIVITKVERMDASPIALLKGIVTAKDAGLANITILGIIVPTTVATQFRDTNDASMTQAAFFTGITTGTTVVKIRWDSGIISAAASRAELELN